MDARRAYKLQRKSKIKPPKSSGMRIRTRTHERRTISKVLWHFIKIILRSNTKNEGQERNSTKGEVFSVVMSTEKFMTASSKTKWCLVKERWKVYDFGDNTVFSPKNVKMTISRVCRSRSAVQGEQLKYYGSKCTVTKKKHQTEGQG